VGKLCAFYGFRSNHQIVADRQRLSAPTMLMHFGNPRLERQQGITRNYL